MAGCSISSLSGGAIGAVMMMMMMLFVGSPWSSPWVTITVSPAVSGDRTMEVVATNVLPPPPPTPLRPPPLSYTSPQQCAAPFPLEKVIGPDDVDQDVDAPWWRVLGGILEPEQSKSWSFYHKDICDYIEQNVKDTANLRWVEIGTCYGGTSNAIAIRFPTATVVAVDPFLGEYTDPNGVVSVQETNMYTRFAKNIRTLKGAAYSRAHAEGLLRQQRAKHGCRYHLINNFSSVVGREFAATNVELFDVAFIDGLHTYEGAKVDTDLFAPLVKQGGLIIWNDYTQFFPGVVKAVDEYLAVNKVTLVKGSGGVPPGATNVAVVKP